jgi:hypothetical protein
MLVEECERKGGCTPKLEQSRSSEKTLNSRKVPVDLIIVAFYAVPGQDCRSRVMEL